MPFVPGMEVAGVVIETGEDVRDLAVGQRVIAVMVSGGYAEYMVASAAFVASLPDEVEFLLAAGTALQALTAYFLSHATFRVGEGNAVLIHSAASAVGGYLSAMASRAGAQVIGAVSTPEKSAHALSRGCTQVEQYGIGDLVSAVRSATNGAGVDVVYDFCGAETFLDSLKCLKPRGLLVLCGQSSGPTGPFDPQLLRKHGSLYLTRPTLIDYMKPVEAFRNMTTEVWELLKQGVLTPHPVVCFPLGQADLAHQQLADRNRVAKLVLNSREI
jgi:NADPH2:quinone reductase